MTLSEIPQRKEKNKPEHFEIFVLKDSSLRFIKIVPSVNINRYNNKF